MAADNADRAWELMESIGTCLLITRVGEVVGARPMAAYVKKDEHAVYFLTDAGSRKDDEIAADPDVVLAFVDSGSERCVVVKGIARVSDDRAKIRDLWTPVVRAWWDNADDPAIRLITVSPQHAEIWDSPGKIASAVAMITAAVTGARPMSDETKKTAL